MRGGRRRCGCIRFPGSPALLPHPVQEAFSSVGIRLVFVTVAHAVVDIVLFLLTWVQVVVGDGSVCGRCEGW